MSILSRMNYFETLYKLGSYWALLKTQIIYKHLFKNIGYRSRIKRTLRIKGSKFIEIGDHVTINPYTWLLAIKHEGHCPSLIIDSGSEIGNFNHITCVRRVHIGKSVLTADKVHISDNSHSFESIEIPIKDQRVTNPGEVSIGDGTWLGEGVSILGCSIGKQCIIGANAVVVKNIPDYSIAVGVPAKVIKKYNLEKNEWERV